MRWKLLVITSLAATVAGAGLCALLVHLLSASTVRAAAADPLAAATLILPAASIAYAAVFVYRHTARRRKLQAVLTAVFSLVLTVGALLATAIIRNRALGRLPPQPRSSSVEY